MVQVKAGDEDGAQRIEFIREHRPQSSNKEMGHFGRFPG